MQQQQPIIIDKLVHSQSVYPVLVETFGESDESFQAAPDTYQENWTRHRLYVNATHNGEYADLLIVTTSTETLERLSRVLAWSRYYG